MIVSSTSETRQRASQPNGFRAPGPVASTIIEALTGFPPFDKWCTGIIDRVEYVAALDELLARSTSIPLTENQRALSARMHWQPDDLVDQTLTSCAAQALLTSYRYDIAAFRRFQEHMTAWDHGGRSTFIFPEEAQLLYAVANITRPRRIVVLGSYYGYWAAWAIGGAEHSLESIVLIDVDPAVNALASSNLRHLGLNAKASVVTGDAAEYMRLSTDPVDLIVLDAEGPQVGSDPRLLRKAIYGPITETALPHLNKGGHLVVHNVLVDRLVAHPYFDALVARNKEELAEFLMRVGSMCHKSFHVPTTEGVGLYLK